MESNKELPDLTIDQFRLFADIILRKANITLKENKITLLTNRLRKRLRVLNLNDFDEYYRIIGGPNSQNELRYFLEVITTNETYFWRTIQNFELLKKHIVPTLLKTFKNESLNFWSAGCSTGEEPYNMAIELIEAMKKAGFFDFIIRATDISHRVIDIAIEGQYSGRKIEKVPKAILRRYFSEETDKKGVYTVRPDIKKKIEFMVSNLFEPAADSFHCIFCRNVMIYFSRKAQEKLSQIFYKNLKPGGFLIIGHSESLQMLDTQFQTVSFDNGTIYHKPLS